MMSNQNQTGVFQSTFGTEESKIVKKMRQNPILALASVGFLGIAGYRIYTARNRGGMKLSFFLIHTRLAAQGFATAALGTMVIYSLYQRLSDKIFPSASSPSDVSSSNK